MKTSGDTILLVEDDPNDVLLMQRAFRKANLTNPLPVARDGQEAIEYLNHQGHFADVTRYPPPTLMLLDLKMPRKDGFETLEWLRQQPGLKRIVVIVLSSSSELADINRAYDLGANSYLVKPGDFLALVDLVNSLASYWLAVNRKSDLQDEVVAVSGRSCAQTQPA
jgi:CheY-like chemotaxis protein